MRTRTRSASCDLLRKSASIGSSRSAKATSDGLSRSSSCTITASGIIKGSAIDSLTVGSSDTRGRSVGVHGSAACSITTSGPPDPRYGRAMGHFGHFRQAVAEFVAHYHHERNHQGLGNNLIDGQTRRPAAERIRRRQRLGGLLNYYERAA